MGPTKEFIRSWTKTFHGCIDALTDTVAGNDNLAFRLLPKTLAFIPEMKKDAQIAYSSQFSICKQAPEAVKVAHGAVSVSAIAPFSTASAQAPIEQSGSSCAIECDGCGKTFSGWTQGPVYGCIICMMCDLCEGCWTKIGRCNKGEPWAEWKCYCGHNHKYVKGPVLGWKGVSGGVLKFQFQYPANKGETIGQVEEIKFTDWSDAVQERCSEAWKEFWGREELVVDIL